ncbi:metallophosphoesterase [Paenibacillus sp. NPDC057886]|uniref:metallophosphoesterase n=1 Tax=Paenibacillus sp. NPDC057886 TaxID=3346270 RepID=UPI00368A2882
MLVITGDLGHRNKQNYALLCALKRYYTHILLVAGNHDYYLVNSKERYKLQTSINRWVEMKALVAAVSKGFTSWKETASNGMACDMEESGCGMNSPTVFRLLGIVFRIHWTSGRIK